MAITRAQQAKQMLRKGGRIGLKGGADASQFDKPRSEQKTPNVSAGGASFNKLDDAPSGDDIRRNKEEFETAVGKADLERLKEEGVPKSNVPGLLGLGLNATKKLRDFALRKNIEYFEGLSTSKNPKTAQGYKDYMSDRLAGKIDAAGNTIITGGDDPFIPMNQMSTNMDQVPEEEVLSPIQQALLDRGDASAFLATGGRVGLKGGADASKSDFKTPSTTAKQPPSMGFGNPPPGAPSGGDGGNNNQPPQKIKVPKTVKDVGNTAGELMFLKNVFKLNPVGIMKNVGSKLILDKLISEADTDQDQNMMLADVSASDINRLLGTNLYGKQKYAPNQDIDLIRMSEPTLNPTITDKEIRGVLEGTITEPTGQFAAADGGMPSYEGGIMDLESGRQMYVLGKLVKKATRAVKKIVKSPIGKAALIGGLGYIAGGGGMPKFLGGRGLGGFEFANIFSKKNPLFFSTKDGEQVFSPFKASSLFALSPLFLEEDTNEEDYQKFLAERGKGAQLPAPIPTIRDKYKDYLARGFLAEGGKAEPVAKKTMPLLDMDGKEMDLREDGGFVPIGRMERADDVPARLSKNEFVFTADAVRNAGEGDIDKGAEVMYNMMKNLEAGGEVSEESQGLEGARKMFQTSQRLEEVL